MLDPPTNFAPQVMSLLSELYSKFDKAANELKLYTVDTIGDSELPRECCWRGCSECSCV